MSGDAGMICVPTLQRNLIKYPDTAPLPAVGMDCFYYLGLERSKYSPYTHIAVRYEYCRSHWGPYGVITYE